MFLLQISNECTDFRSLFRDIEVSKSLIWTLILHGEETSIMVTSHEKNIYTKQSLRHLIVMAFFFYGEILFVLFFMPHFPMESYACLKFS